ncbi:MAG: ribosome silencing factor [Christensenellales bacterium]|jgi:ribosome-associated protein
MLSTLYDGKAEDILVLETSKLTIIADYFIICSGRSSIQVKSLSDKLEEAMEAHGITATRKEGYQAGRWIVLDYSDVLVHIFHSEEREFYNLERLWTDGENCRNYSAQRESAKA